MHPISSALPRLQLRAEEGAPRAEIPSAQPPRARQSSGAALREQLAIVAALRAPMEGLSAEEFASAASDLMKELNEKRAGGQNVMLVSLRFSGGGGFAGAFTEGELATLLASDDSNSMGTVNGVSVRDALRKALGADSKPTGGQGDGPSARDQMARIIAEMIETARDGDAGQARGVAAASRPAPPDEPATAHSRVDGHDIGIVHLSGSSPAAREPIPRFLVDRHV